MDKKTTYADIFAQKFISKYQFIKYANENNVEKLIELYNENKNVVVGLTTLNDLCMSKDLPFKIETIEWLCSLEEISTETIVSTAYLLMNFFKKDSWEYYLEAMRVLKILFKARSHDYTYTDEFRKNFYELCKYDGFRDEELINELLRASKSTLGGAILFKAIEANSAEIVRSELASGEYDLSKNDLAMNALFFHDETNQYTNESSKRNKRLIYNILIENGANRIVYLDGDINLRMLIDRKYYFYLDILFEIYPNAEKYPLTDDICEGNLTLFKYIYFELKNHIIRVKLIASSKSILKAYFQTATIFTISERFIDNLISLGAKLYPHLLIDYARYVRANVNPDIISKFHALLSSDINLHYHIQMRNEYGRDIGYYISFIDWHQIGDNNSPVFLNFKKVIEMIVSFGYDINIQFTTNAEEYEITDYLLLNLAIRHEKLIAIKFLLKLGANPNLVDESLFGVLGTMRFMSVKHRIIRKLIKYGLRVEYLRFLKNSIYEEPFSRSIRKRNNIFGENLKIRAFIAILKNVPLEVDKIPEVIFEQSLKLFQSKGFKWIIHYFDIYRPLKLLQLHFSSKKYWNDELFLDDTEQNNAASSSSSTEEKGKEVLTSSSSQKRQKDENRTETDEPDPKDQRIDVEIE